MSTLLLIRHGQASHGAKDYDVLSALGEEQSRRLGAWMAARGARLDGLYVGPLRRQRGTVEHISRGSEDAGGGPLAASVDERLAEYPAHAVVRRFAPELVADDPHYGALMASNDGRGSAAVVDPVALQRLFERVIAHWATRDLCAPEIECWSAFADRVEASMSAIIARHGRGQTVAVVTSGGVIAVTVARVLGLEARRALLLSWALNNASITELKWRGAELSLARFNTVPHLGDPKLLTFV